MIIEAAEEMDVSIHYTDYIAIYLSAQLKVRTKLI